MEKTKVKIPAKINLTLDVFETKDKFHPINSLVSSIDLFDEIILKKRKDHRITVTEIGIKSGCSVSDNNAYKSAKLYRDAFSTLGVDIILNKRIPIGAGLGGSSADIAGVIICMEKLFQKNADLIKLANSLGSDSGYMINGGMAILSGRGDIIQNISDRIEFNLLIITEKEGVSTKECYKLFDSEKSTAPCTAVVAEALLRKDYSVMFWAMKNDLYNPAIKLLSKIKDNISALNSVGALKAMMTGSGSAVYGIFKDRKSLNTAYKKLLPKFGDRLIKAKTI